MRYIWNQNIDTIHWAVYNPCKFRDFNLTNSFEITILYIHYSVLKSVNRR